MRLPKRHRPAPEDVHAQAWARHADAEWLDAGRQQRLRSIKQRMASDPAWIRAEEEASAEGVQESAEAGRGGTLRGVAEQTVREVKDFIVARGCFPRRSRCEGSVSKSERHLFERVAWVRRCSSCRT